MRRVFKQVVSIFLIPLTKWYLRKDRFYSYESIRIKILTGVFHPGLFPSTTFLISYLKEHNIANQTFLELGCGTGLISVFAAKKGAWVTACDLNPKAVENCKLNAAKNNVTIEIVLSDLFKSLNEKKYDWVVINPPYYARPATNHEELAWNCGENFEYFQSLFAQLSKFIHDDSIVVMVLTQTVELEQIKVIAMRHHFLMVLVKEQHALFDGKDFLFQVKKSTA